VEGLSDGRRPGKELARLIERSSDLKRDLVGFARSPRMQRSLAAAMRESGLEEDLEGADAISFLDRFGLQYRMRDGRTVVDRFVACRPDLDAADRELLLGWRDPVEGIFEIRGQDRDAIILLNLIDDLEYRTYSNMGPAAFQGLPKRGFVHTRLVPIRLVRDAWLVSGMMSSYPASSAGWIAKVAMELATKQPRLVFRNPDKIEQGWKQMREDRARFVEFFGHDELVLPPAEAEERLNEYYRQRQEAALARRAARGRPSNLPGVDRPAFRFPPGLAEADTVGVLFDDVDGLNFYPEYGMLRDLFGDPALVADKRYAEVLRGYLGSETIAPLPLRRLAGAHPDTVDAVFRKILRQRDFTWAEDGEALMRHRKAWYFEREPRPGVSVIGARLMELASDGRG
jgi:hypothetical protein